MQITVNAIKLQFGQIEDNGFEWANLQYLSDEIKKTETSVGQEVAKVKVDSKDSNKLAKLSLINDLVPGFVNLTLQASERSGKMEMVIVDIEPADIESSGL